jgi:DNA-binding GntR family transcriptional regulator
MEGGRYSDDDLEHLGRLAQRLDELEESGGDIFDTIKADVEFHHLICSRCGHGLLLETFKTLQSLMWLFVLNVQLYRSDAYSDEPGHVEIYEAIRSGDPQRASETLRNHILAAGKALLFCMEDGGAGRG